MDNNQQMNQGQGYDPQAYQQMPNQQMYQQAPQQGYNPQAYQQGYDQQMYQQMPNQQVYQQGYNQQMYQQAPQQAAAGGKKPMSKGAKLGLILGLSIGIPVIALILILCLIPKRGASTPTAAAEGFMKGWLNHNTSQMKKYSMPAKLEKGLKNRGSLDYYYMSEYIDDYYEDSTGVVSMYSSVDDIYDYDDIMDFNEDMADYGLFFNATEAQSIKVNFTYRYGYSTDDDYEYLDVIKVGGKWYVLPEEVLEEIIW